MTLGWLRPQIAAIQPKKIERAIARLATAGHEVIEVRASFGVQYDNLAIQNGTVSLQAAQNLLKKRVKLTELLSLARHQPCLLAVDIKDPAKAVMLQLVDPIRMTDRLLQRR